MSEAQHIRRTHHHLPAGDARGSDRSASFAADL
jgi:hypothetical protein